MAEDKTGSAESKKDFGDPPTGSVAYWLAEIKAYGKTFESWETRAQSAVDRYRNEAKAGSERDYGTGKYNLLWANVQTLQPALYSKVPKPDITRTHKDQNQVTRSAAVILERAVRQEINTGGFDEAMRSARDDYLLTARGQIWVRYVPTYGDETREKLFLQQGTTEPPTYTQPDGTPYTPKTPVQMDGAQPYVETGDPYRPVVSECCKQEHIRWKDFGHTPAPTWSKVRAVWKRELMTRTQLVERFGKETGNKVGLTQKAQNVSDEDVTTYGDAFKRGEVWEIWDKTTHKVLWISKGYSDGPLDEIADPLKLEGFFPCPPPVYGTTTTDSLVPVTDYSEYRTQADEIDTLTARISLLIKACRIIGAYDGSVPELGQILKGSDNKLVPVDSWAMFAERGGIQGGISFLPIKDIADAIVVLSGAREQLKRDLQEITGIADIVRGQSDPNETLGAQQIKRQFVGMRIDDRQANMGRFARGIIQITAEIIAEHFSPETLYEISGWEHSDEARALDRAVADWEQQQAPQIGHNGGPPMVDPNADPNAQPDPNAQQPDQAAQPPPPPPTERPPSSKEIFDQAVELLRSDKLRGYTIDVNTDTMVFQDQQDEQQQQIDLMTAITQYLQQAVPAAMQYPALAPALIEMLMATVRRFKAGPSLEAALEQALTALTEASGQPQPPDPATEAAAVEAKARLEALQQKSQADQAKAQSDQQAAQLDAQIKQQQMQANAEAARMDMQAKQAQAAITLQTLQAKREAEAMKHEQDMAKGALELAKLKAELAFLQQSHLAEQAAKATEHIQPPHAPSESIAFKDVPPAAQAQMLEQAGIHTTPEALATHAAEQRAADAKAAAAKKPTQGP